MFFMLLLCRRLQINHLQLIQNIKSEEKLYNFFFLFYSRLSIWEVLIMISRLHSLMGCSSGGLGSIPADGKPDCSGRGECMNGTCLCEIRYSGDECSGFNLPYHAGISSVFFFVALVSLIQLMICIAAEYQRLKQPTFLRACRLTTQKLLYFVVCMAALIRGAYFTIPVII